MKNIPKNKIDKGLIILILSTIFIGIFIGIFVFDFIGPKDIIEEKKYSTELINISEKERFENGITEKNYYFSFVSSSGARMEEQVTKEIYNKYSTGDMITVKRMNTKSKVFGRTRIEYEIN